MHRSRVIAQRSVAVAAFAGALVITSLGAYWHAFTTWSRYDDEGSHLQWMRLLLKGHPLYTSLDAYHGPFHFELMALLYRFDSGAATSDGARFVVVVAWILTSLGAGLVVRRATGSVLCGIAGLIGWWSACFVLGAEPGHPILSVVILFCAAGATVALAIAPQPRRGMLLLGVISGALLMTKINIGVLMLLAIAFAAALTLPSLRRLRVVAALAGIALPFVLMGAHLGDDQWLKFAEIVGVAGAAIGVAASAGWGSGSDADRDFEWRVLLLWLAGCAAATVVAILVLLPFGTALGDVLYTAFIRPAGHPDLFMVTLPIPSTAFLSMAAIVASLALLRFRPPPARTESLLRLVAGGVILYTAAHEPNPDARTSWSLLVPALLAWVTVLPPQGVVRGLWDQFANTAIAAAAVFETLHSYPVAGAQRGSSTVLFVFVGAMCVRSGLQMLDADPARLRKARLATGVALLALLIPTVVVPLTRTTHKAYAQDVPLHFPGATHMRLPAGWALTYRNLVFLLRHECDAMVSEPGYFTLNLWSGLPVLADKAMDEWMPLLSTADQQKVVDALAKYKRPCAIRDREGVAFWMQGNPVPRKPLVRAIAAMTTVAQAGTFEFAVPKWRAAAVNRDLDKRLP